MPTLVTGTSFATVAEMIHSAVLLGPAAWGDHAHPGVYRSSRSVAQLADELTQLFSLLNQRQIPYALVGGMAMLCYVDGRNTEDVDLVLSAEGLNCLPEIAISSRNCEHALGMFSDLQVDVLLSDNPVFDLVQRQYVTTHHFLEMDVHCATVEGLILLKLYALPALHVKGDGQRIGLYENDLYMLCERHRPRMVPLLKMLEPFVTAGQLDELRKIAVEIQQRIDRVDKARPPQ